MLDEYFATKEEAIEAARLSVDSDYSPIEVGQRRWLVGAAPDCYENKRYGCQIHVLEGSPAKGFVLVVGGRSGEATALNCAQQVIGSFYWS